MQPANFLGDELLDFFAEMLNIGVGHAAEALGQLLSCPVRVTSPAVRVLSAAAAPLGLADPTLDVVGVRMRILGDVPGRLFFIIPTMCRQPLLELLARQVPNWQADPASRQLDVLAEVANILAGCYFRAIDDFCKLKLYQTVPVVTQDMFRAVVDETLVNLARDVERAILVVNEFIVDQARAKVSMLIFLSNHSQTKLATALGEARKAYGDG